MCGIAGFNWKDEAEMRKLCASLSHRGPDQEGYYADISVTLGHKRLSIIDPSPSGIQPMANENKTILITFNGEIFNFAELRQNLQKYTFKSGTDTEVIIHAYEEYGEECINKLNGQFAFAIYDVTKQTLFLARDRVGINPLYYYFDGKKFIFGSELKVIINSEVPKQINEYALHYYLAYGYTPGKQSIFDNTYKLEPGHYMVFDLRENKITTYKKYWDVSYTSEITDEQEAVKHIREQLEKSVKSRLVADVPVGAFLSGGVDSSAIVATAAKYKKNLNTFSVKFDHADFDESKYAYQIARKFGTKHHVVKFSAKDVKKLIKKLPFHYDEPFADPSMVPTYLVSKVARQHVTVSLSGDGGDELFAGYTAHQNYRILQLQNYYPRFFNYLAYFVLKKFSNPSLQKVKAFFEIGKLPKQLRYGRLMSYLTQEEFHKLTGKNPRPLYQHYTNYFSQDYVNTAINSDLHIYLPEDILTKIDRASLANSLESRPPFLDHEMVELACRINSSLKIKDKKGKHVLKKALEGILPETILQRKKMGFAMPLERYLRTELKQLVYKYVFRFKDHNYFNADFIKELEQKFASEKWESTYHRIIWTLLMFNLWWEQWISTKKPTRTKDTSALEKTGKSI